MTFHFSRKAIGKFASCIAISRKAGLRVFNKRVAALLGNDIMLCRKGCVGVDAEIFNYVKRELGRSILLNVFSTIQKPRATIRVKTPGALGALRTLGAPGGLGTLETLEAPRRQRHRRKRSYCGSSDQRELGDLHGTVGRGRGTSCVVVYTGGYCAGIPCSFVCVLLCEFRSCCFQCHRNSDAAVLVPS